MMMMLNVLCGNDNYYASGFTSTSQNRAHLFRLTSTSRARDAGVDIISRMYALMTNVIASNSVWFSCSSFALLFYSFATAAAAQLVH